MIQSIIVVIAFAAALLYVGRLVFRSFQSRSTGCDSGCGKCGAVDFARLEEQLKQKGF